MATKKPRKQEYFTVPSPDRDRAKPLSPSFNEVVDRLEHTEGVTVKRKRFHSSNAASIVFTAEAKVAKKLEAEIPNWVILPNFKWELS